MRKFFIVFVNSMIFIGLGIPNATAGLFDKLNAATQKIEQATQRMEQTSQQVNSVKQTAGKAQAFAKTKTSNPITGEWGNQVTCAGPNSATCQNGMDNLVNCMHQTKGYYYKLVAANLQEKLDKGEGYANDDERAALEEDVASLQDAIDQEKDAVVDPDPDYPQRYLSWLTEEDQHAINKVNIKYVNEVRDDCDKRFGGMSQFSK